MNNKTANEIINELQNTSGEDFARVSRYVLERLRHAYNGDNETQNHINEILTKLNNIIY